MSRSYEQELEQIRISNKGKRLLPEEVVEYARTHKRSELYQCFEWEESVAAEKWRIAQAGDLIRAVVRIIPNPKGGSYGNIRAYISLPTDRVMRLGYRTVEDVLNDPESEAEMLAALRAEIEAQQKRYSAIERLAPIFKDFIKRVEDAGKGKGRGRGRGSSDGARPRA